MNKKRIIGLDWLSIVAKQHDEWVEIVNGFGEFDYAEDIVQTSYEALIRYARPDKIIKNNKVNRGYMYFTLRSMYFQYYNAKKKVIKIMIDDDDSFLQLADETDLEEHEAYNKICLLVDELSEDWSWYDRKLFKIYSDTGLSVRKIAAETNISWVSIYNTLKNCKNEVRDKLNEDYLDYKNKDYDKI